VKGRVFGLATALAAFALASASVAEPSRWERVENPRAAAAARVLRTAVHARSARDLSSEPVPGAESLLALRAAMLLTMQGGEALESTEVWFFLGDAEVSADHGLDEDALRVLGKALAAEPGSPLAAHAHLDVAIAASRLGRFDEARSACREALGREWDSATRARIHLLSGDVALALGDPSGARTDYTSALEETPSAEVRALARWGMAVAYAREDDLPDALSAVWDPSRPQFQDAQGNAITVLELPSVRLLKSYDVFFYRALASMAASEHADEGAPEKKVELEWAISQWKRYVAEARSASDRRADSAARLLRSTELRLERLGASSRRLSGHGRSGVRK
jgi:predicted negative regulator of RcsB-dependent stress response